MATWSVQADECLPGSPLGPLRVSQSLCHVRSTCIPVADFSSLPTSPGAIVILFFINIYSHWLETPKGGRVANFAVIPSFWRCILGCRGREGEGHPFCCYICRCSPERLVICWHAYVSETKESFPSARRACVYVPIRFSAVSGLDASLLPSCSRARL